jgi:DNA-binding MarR family transcriptional regulator
MLFLEEYMEYPQGLGYPEISEKLSEEDDFSQIDIFYSLKKLGELGYLEIKPNVRIEQSVVLDITVEGHEYIHQLRDKKNFNI